MVANGGRGSRALSPLMVNVLRDSDFVDGFNPDVYVPIKRCSSHRRVTYIVAEVSSSFRVFPLASSSGGGSQHGDRQNSFI